MGGILGHLRCGCLYHPVCICQERILLRAQSSNCCKIMRHLFCPGVLKHILGRALFIFTLHILIAKKLLGITWHYLKQMLL